MSEGRRQPPQPPQMPTVNYAPNLPQSAYGKESVSVDNLQAIINDDITECIEAIRKEVSENHRDLPLNKLLNRPEAKKILKEYQAGLILKMCSTHTLTMPSRLDGGRMITATVGQWLVYKLLESAIIDNSHSALMYLLNKLPSDSVEGTASNHLHVHQHTLDPIWEAVLSTPGGILETPLMKKAASAKDVTPVEDFEL